MATTAFTAATLLVASGLISLGMCPPITPASVPSPPGGSVVSTATAERPATPPKVTFLAANGLSTVVLAQNGRLYGTGDNRWRQQTGEEDRRQGLTAMIPLPGNAPIERVAVGQRTTVVIDADGVPYGVGEGGLTGPVSASFLPIEGLPDGVTAVRISAGFYDTLVVGDDGVAYGTGMNHFGQVTGTAYQKRRLQPLAGLPVGVRATDVAAGTSYSLVLGSDGRTYGAGRNKARQLTGTENEVRALRPLTGLPNGVRATALAAGGQHVLVLGDNGQVYGAGRNAEGQLTNRTDRPRATLTRLVGLPKGVSARAIAAGSLHSVVLGEDNVVYGAGSNADGQLSGSGQRNVLTPVQGLPQRVRPMQIAAGDRFTVVRASDGLVYGTGANDHGQLTGNDEPRRLRPLAIWRMGGVAVPEPLGTAVPGSTMHAGPGRWIPAPERFSYQWMRNGRPIPGATAAGYAVRSSDLFMTVSVRVSAMRAGYRTATQTSHPRLVAAKVAPQKAVRVLAVDETSLLVAEDGRTYAAGDGRTALTALPPLPGEASTTDLAASWDHTLILGSDGQVYGLGSGRSGQLTGGNKVRTVPTALSGLPEGIEAIDVAAGDGFSAVLGEDGIVYGTGTTIFEDAEGYQIEVRTLTPVPGLPSGVEGAALSASASVLTVLTTAGTLYTRSLWGGDRSVDWHERADLPPGVTPIALASTPGTTRVIASDGHMYVSTAIDDPFVAVDLPGALPISRMSSSGSRFLYIDGAGIPRGKGDNRLGQFTAPELVVTTPTVLTGLPVGVLAADVSAAPLHSLVLGDDGAVYGTGQNLYGQITGADGQPRWGLQPLIWTLRPFQRPTIAGVSQVGRTLTASPGAWWPEPGAYTYQWFRDGALVAGAVDASYRLRGIDKYAEMSVSVTARKAGYRPRTVTVRTNDVVRPAP